VDEIIVFDDGEEGAEAARPVKDDSTYTAFSHPSHFLSHLLSYLETPAHLRKALFSMHPNLRTAGTLPSLDMPHHLRSNEWCKYREGISGYSAPEGTYVDVGLNEHKLIEGVEIPPNTRITVKLSPNSTSAEAVSPVEPREKAGYYWGYTVRQCNSLSAVLTECPFDGGYDISIGTSERGKPLHEAFSNDAPQFQHLLLVLGGVSGLETAAINDPELSKMEIGKANIGELFDHWVNVLPGQGSRTIRTEEAVWLALMGTRRLVEER
jgi:predicted SPOUT superfamily RNA methylase MTH1